MSISTVMKKVSMAATGAAFIALGSAAPSIAVTISYNGDTTGQPTWNRPIEYGSNAPTTVSVVANATPYNSQPFFVNISGLYNFLSQRVAPSSWDNYLFLYQNSFNPSNPLVNVLIGNDDFASGVSGFNNVSLTAATQYFLVTTGFLNNSFGTFTNTITGPGDITLSNAESVPEPITILGTLTGMMFGTGLCRKYKNLMKTTIKV